MTRFTHSGHILHKFIFGVILQITPTPTLKLVLFLFMQRTRVRSERTVHAWRVQQSSALGNTPRPVKSNSATEESTGTYHTHVSQYRKLDLLLPGYLLHCELPDLQAYSPVCGVMILVLDLLHCITALTKKILETAYSPISKNNAATCQSKNCGAILASQSLKTYHSILSIDIHTMQLRVNKFNVVMILYWLRRIDTISCVVFSDLDRTLKSEEKWKKYEVQQAVQMGILPNTAEKPESRCPIASLSLETFGKTLSTDDIEVLRHEVTYSNVTYCSSLVLKQVSLCGVYVKAVSRPHLYFL